MARVSSNKDVSKYVKQLLRQGYSLHYGKKHFKLLFPDGRIAAFISGSPSDSRRGVKNLQAEIKRRGKDG